jgi:flagellar P-ring protein precursor FlgI
MKNFFVILALLGLSAHATDGVRLKELARVEGVRDNMLTGYGLVVGLSGSGDSPRNRATVQSLSNALAAFGVSVPPDALASRNVAAVIVTATLPPFAASGDRLDVQVSSAGDARSLTGGTLLLTPLYGADQALYATAQGALSVGGYSYDLFGNLVQKNHPTVAVVSGGALVERAVPTPLTDSNGTIAVLLNQPDFTTAQRVAVALGEALPGAKVKAEHAGRISVDAGDGSIVELVSRIENVMISPDQLARVVINERTGTVVAGGDVRIGDVSISHGDLRLVVTTRFNVSQPSFPVAFGRVDLEGSDVRTVVVPETDIKVSEDEPSLVTLPSGTTVGDLVGALHRIKLSTRDVITILQAIKSAGALHGELVVQ